jgi:omega-6 fatty acid desaturase (delta-12 desaturase)
MLHASQTTPPPAKPWPAVLAPYRKPRLAQSLVELVCTLGPFVALWVAMWMALEAGYWLSLLLAIPTAAFLVRLFMIQHDCSHDAFFGNRAANTWAGRMIGVLTLTPFGAWRRSHSLHHASSGNLDQRGIGDITTLTVEEYRSRSTWGRLLYRAYRHPLVMFGIGPAYLFLLQHRLPVGLMRGHGVAPWVSAMGTNLAIAVVALVAIWAMGLSTFLMLHLPVAVLAASAGVWLFYVQHQFEDTSWERTGEWSHADAALHGSSHYVLPPVLRWFSANIGAHHVHHLSSRIPFYRLPEVLRDHPELNDLGRLTLRESLGCVKLVLWDEAERRLIPFAGLAALPRANTVAQAAG